MKQIITNKDAKTFAQRAKRSWSESGLSIGDMIITIGFIVESLTDELAPTVENASVENP